MVILYLSGLVVILVLVLGIQNVLRVKFRDILLLTLTNAFSVGKVESISVVIFVMCFVSNICSKSTKN